MPPKQPITLDVLAIFEEAQAKYTNCDGITHSRDVEADTKARRRKADLDDAFMRTVDRHPFLPDAVSDMVWAKALAGDMDATKFLAQRISGNVPLRNELTGKDGEPLFHSDKPINELNDDELRILAASDQG